MNIHIPCVSDQNIGGGYTFYGNFQKAMAAKFPDVHEVSEFDKHDILFAFSVTTVSGETIDRSKKSGAKFILRMDGVPEDSRNSGRGTRRLIEYSLKADWIIYQSEFIQRTVGRILADNGVKQPHNVVHNGVDVDIFTPNGDKIAFKGSPKILHMAYRKDQNKRYEEVLAMYREYWTYNKEANLYLLGRYPSEWMNYNMGFFNGERHQRLGIVTDPVAKAAMIRSCDFLFYPSFADPAPNVVLEAMACGVPVMYHPYGGSNEIVIDNAAGMAIDPKESYISQINRMMENREAYSVCAREIATRHSLEIMAINYMNVFQNAQSV